MPSGKPGAVHIAKRSLCIFDRSIAGAEDVAQLAYRQFALAMRLVGLQATQKELLHLGICRRQPLAAGGFGSFGAGLGRHREPDVGEHIEQIAVRGVDQATHVPHLVGVIAPLF